MSTNLSQFPDWFQSLILLIAAVSILYRHIASLIKLLSAPPVLALLRGIPAVAKKLLRFFQNLLVDPYPYSYVFTRIKRFLAYGSVVHGYLMSAVLFLYFMILVIIVAGYPSHLSVKQYCLALVWCIGCLIMSAATKAQAGKELLKLRGKSPI